MQIAQARLGMTNYRIKTVQKEPREISRWSDQVAVMVLGTENRGHGRCNEFCVILGPCRKSQKTRN